MSTPQTFDFNGNPVRVYGTADAPLFVAVDAGRCLDIAEIRSTLRDFPDDEKGVHTVHTPGGPQEMLCLTEAGLYRLIFQSRKEQAEAFRRWVFHGVLPSIRKTGRYEAPKAPPPLSLEARAEKRIDIAQKGRNLLEQLGGVDAKDESLIRSVIANAMRDLGGKSTTTRDGRLDLGPDEPRSIEDVALEAGLSIPKPRSSPIGRTVAKAYRAAYGQEPEIRHRDIGGQMRPVKVYPPAFAPAILDEIRRAVPVMATRVAG